MSDPTEDGRRLAEAATPGGWCTDERDPLVVWTIHKDAPGGEIVVARCGLRAADDYPRGENHPAENMAHIAFWSPARALLALSIIEAASVRTLPSFSCLMCGNRKIPTEHYQECPLAAWEYLGSDR